MEYDYRNGKYIISKDGVYFSIKPEQIDELLRIVEDLKQIEEDLKK